MSIFDHPSVPQVKSILKPELHEMVDRLAGIDLVLRARLTPELYSLVCDACGLSQDILLAHQGHTNAER